MLLAWRPTWSLLDFMKESSNYSKWNIRITMAVKTEFHVLHRPLRNRQEDSRHRMNYALVRYDFPTFSNFQPLFIYHTRSTKLPVFLTPK